MKAVALVSVILVAGCAEPPRTDEPRPAPDGPTIYEATTMVSTDVDDRAMLCLAGHPDIARPPCAGVPVTNWDWDEVQSISEESGEGWGRFQVVGTFDGEAFTLTERPEAPKEAESTPRDLGFTPPCPEPPGGWPIPDPDRVSRRALETAGRTAERQRDYAGHWIDYIAHGPQAGYTGRVIIVIAFAGDPQMHEARIRRVWGGALCLTRHRYTLKKLSRIQEQVHGPVGEEIGLWPQASWVDTMRNVAKIQVVVADERDQELLDARYGDGAVELLALLTPVDRS